MGALPAADAWGPFAHGIEPGERVARLRSLRAIVHLLAGPRGTEAKAALLAAEADPEHDMAAHAAVMRLPAIDMRRVLATYAALTRPISL